VLHACRYTLRNQAGLAAGELRKGARHPAPSPPLPLPVVRTVALQLLAGLAFLHSHSIIHADVKPDNVLLAAERAPPAEDCSAFLQEDDDDAGATAAAAAAASAAADKLQLQELVLGEQWRGSCRAGLVVKLCDFGNVVHADQVNTYFTALLACARLFHNLLCWLVTTSAYSECLPQLQRRCSALHSTLLQRVQCCRSLYQQRSAIAACVIGTSQCSAVSKVLLQ
jgi:serine/threonine protein kinase